MDFCQHCGKEIHWDDQVCPHCKKTRAHDGDRFPRHMDWLFALAAIAYLIYRFVL